jgi:hypothetical protein
VRSNGLTAPAYTPVADLDPVLANELLSDLGRQGIAAYIKPVESSSTAAFERPEFRLWVRERLYVDTAASARVRGLLSERDPHLLDVNDDLTWAQLVAGFDQPLSDASAPWPASEDLGPADGSGGGAPTGPVAASGTDTVLPFTDLRNRAGGLGSREEPDQSASAPSDGTFDGGPAPRAEPFDDADFLASTSTTAARDEEPFVPAPPPPLPRPAPHRQVAWLGLISGPILLLLVALFGLRPPDWVAFLGVLGFIGGFIALVATMTDRDDGEWGSDDGAVV